MATEIEKGGRFKDCLKEKMVGKTQSNLGIRKVRGKV
jgi:hypothetical protein